MAATIKIKNSSTTGAVPTSSDLVQGELAVNVTDLGLYTENASGTVVKLNAPSIDDKNTGATKHLTIDTSGNLGLGVVPSAWGGSYTKALQLKNKGGIVNNVDNDIHLFLNCYYNGTNWIYGASNPASRYEQYNGGHYWFNAASGTAGNAISFTQAMTLDASGKLLVGWTTAPTASASVIANGIQCTNTSGGGGCLMLGTSGGGQQFYTHTGVSGSESYTERMRIDSSGNLDMTGSGSVGRTAGGSGIYFGTNAVLPSTGSALSDNSKSMGNASWRWSVIYAGTGSINTSDATLKQDEQELTQAEKRVALAIKGLIRTFKFKDAVTQKGSAARIHVGVMAQAVRDAFIAEGLDANKYALFCSDTWVDEETNEEKTRLGIRYEELLAFVIAAI